MTRKEIKWLVREIANVMEGHREWSFKVDVIDENDMTWTVMVMPGSPKPKPKPKPAAQAAKTAQQRADLVAVAIQNDILNRRGYLGTEVRARIAKMILLGMSNEGNDNDDSGG